MFFTKEHAPDLSTDDFLKAVEAFGEQNIDVVDLTQCLTAFCTSLASHNRHAAIKIQTAAKTEIEIEIELPATLLAECFRKAERQVNDEVEKNAVDNRCRLQKLLLSDDTQLNVTDIRIPYREAVIKVIGRLLMDHASQDTRDQDYKIDLWFALTERIRELHKSSLALA